jgi:rod shape determining protein RodA
MEVGYGEDRAQRLLRDRVQSRWMAAYDPIKHLDPVLVIAALALTGIGLLAIYSAKLQALTQQGLPTTTFISRQLLALVIGIAAMVVMATVDYRHLRTYAPVLYVLSVFLLLVVLSPLGTEVKGSQRWIVVAGFQLQPSELAKIATLVTIAAVLHELKGNIKLGAVALGLGIAVVPTALVFLQPDLGTSLVFLWTVAVLFLIAGIPARYLVTLALGGLVAMIAALQAGVIEAYQLRRLTSFLDAADPALAQGPAFQTYQSMVAIGSGQFAGKGLFQGTQTALAYVPENHTDFVFTVIGEEFGFIGASVVLGLFVLLVWRALRIAILAKDLFGTLLASGIIAILSLQVFVNVGMNVGIMPVTGLPLPFVSYGGTSLIVWFAMVGLLLNVHMRRF